MVVSWVRCYTFTYTMSEYLILPLYFRGINTRIGFYIMLTSLLGACNVGVQNSTVDNSSQSLNISAFKDITAFVLETAENKHLIKANIKYVKNADEAHSDLREGKADLVFMSYDDTLSIAIESGYNNIAAFAPIHGGILSLCGDINLPQNKNRIGIDTDTGYARALRFYLRQRYPSDLEYNQLDWLYTGATNLRVIELLNGNIDATLLNPPYSYKSGVTRMVKMSEVIGDYQGVVINLNKSWLADAANARALTKFISGYYQRVQEMKAKPDETITQLMAYYEISKTEAIDTYNSLWELDGLSLTPEFDQAKLSGTESIYSWDSKTTIPVSNSWLLKKS